MSLSGSGGAAGGGIQAGKAFVELYLDDSKAKSGLGRIKASFSTLGQSLAKLGAGLGGVGSVVAGNLAGAFKVAIDRGVEFQRLGDKLGVPVEQMSAFAYAAETTGVSLDDLKGHFENLAERVAQGAMGSGEAADTFRRLGINAAQLKLQNPVDQLITLSESMSKVTNETDRLGMLSTLGGDQFQWLNSLFKLKPDGIRALMSEAKGLGAVVSGEEAKQATEAWGALNRVWTAAKNGFVSLGAAMLPQVDSIKSVSDSIVKVIGDSREWLSQNKEVVVAVAGGAAALVGIGGGLIALGGVFAGVSAGISAIGVLIGPVTAGFGILTATVGALLTPVGILTAGIAAVGLGLVAFTKQGRGAFESVKGSAVSVGSALSGWAGGVRETATQAWGGISDAIKAGDLGLAAKIALAGVNVEFTKLVAKLTEYWVAFKDVFVNTWKDAVTAVKLTVSGMLIDLSKQLMMSPWWRKYTERFASGASRVTGFLGANESSANWQAAANHIATINASGATPEQIGKAFDELKKLDEANILGARDGQRDRDAEFRKNQIADAKKEMDEAMEELDSLRETARMKAAGMFAPDKSPGQAPPTASMILSSSRGQFGGALAEQSLGGGTIAEKQLNEAKETNDWLQSLDKKLAEELDRERGAVWTVTG